MATIIPACLTDLIGIQPCEGVSPYLRHLTELEGLSIASVAATADPAKWTGARTAIEALVPLGFERTLGRLKDLMAAQGYIMKPVIDTGEFCVFTTKKQSGFFVGDQGMYVQKNPLLQKDSQPIRVKWITLRSPNLTTNIPVNVKDEAGNVLWTYMVATLQADTDFRFDVNQDFYERKIRIVVEGTDMQGYYASCETGGGGCGNCDEPPYSSPINFQRSAFYVNAIEGGEIGGFKSPGVSAAIELPCNDNLFCKYGAELAPAAVYDTGIRILKEWRASTRLNVFTLNKEWVKETMPEWEFEADRLVRSALPNIMNDIVMCFPRCFDCKQPVGSMPALP